MASKSKNPVWSFLASVKLALLLIALLASTSIIGTVIEQNKPEAHYIKQGAWLISKTFQLLPFEAHEHYVEQGGKSFAKVIMALDFDDMYNSVWFLCLLGIFSINLIVCSLDRIPTVIKMVRKDNLATDPDRLPKMKLHKEERIAGSLDSATEAVKKYLSHKGWKPASRAQQYGTLFFAQKGAWTRYGVYVVHLSILIILLGAIIGSSTVASKILGNREFAFKGGISLPETAQSDFVFSYADEKQIPLGFTVRCNYFDIDYYPGTGMPKDYLSGLTIIEDGKEVLTTTIEVNKPLIYKGVTFYQSSYNQLRSWVIKLTDQRTGTVHVFPINPQQINEIHQWQDGETTGMLRIQAVQDDQASIWLMDSTGEPSIFTMPYDRPVLVERPTTRYELRITPHFATGLQVAKDPGVWWVYTGCALMLIGLYLAFFMSHRRIWAHVYEIDGQPMVLFAGHANKNSFGFAKTFSSLTEDFAKKK